MKQLLPPCMRFLSVVARIFRVRGSDLLILPQSVRCVAVRCGAVPLLSISTSCCSLASTAPLLLPGGPAPQPNNTVIAQNDVHEL